MKNRFKLLITITFFVFSINANNFAQNVKNIIHPVNLIAGKKDSILISDMFYSPFYNVNVIPNSNVKMEYNTKNRYLYFTPDSVFKGITLLSIKVNGDSLYFPAIIKKLNYYVFKFKPKKKYKTLTIFGEFNDWNRHDKPFTGPDKNGIYRVKIPLDPGTYQYKFFVDSKEIIDPSNPDSISNGMGGFNSIIKIPVPKVGHPYLHIGKENNNGNKVTFTFFYERNNKPYKLKFNEITALLNNKKISKSHISIKWNKIIIYFNKNELSNNKVLHLAVTQNGIPTNLQIIHLFNGKPAGSSNRFTWYNSAIYSLMIDRFYDGDTTIDKPIVHDSLSVKANYMGGDFQGIIDKLNKGYFDSLGINVIWLTPVYENPNQAYRETPPPHRWFTGYHGYWPISPTKVEEEFGTMHKLKQLIALAHKHGIKILLDIVSHHVHELHPYFKEHRNWFGQLRLPNGKLNLRLWDSHRLTTWFDPFLPTFNYLHSQTAIDTMTSNAIWWLTKTGADGFRHDAVKHIPNKFWRELTRKLKKEIEIPLHKKVYQIGETYGSYKLVSSYVNNGQLDAQFNFNLYNIALSVFLNPKKSFSELNNEMKRTFSVYGTLPLMGNIMDNQDKVRFMAYADGDVPLQQWDATELGWKDPPEVNHPSSYKKGELYFAYMFTIPGIPVIYYGSEFGMTGASDPDNRRMMRFGNQLNKYEKGMLRKVEKIAHLRKKHSALRYGDFYVLKADSNIYAYCRSDFNERLLIVLNKTNSTVRADLFLPDVYNVNQLKDLLGKETITTERNEVSIVLPPYGYRIFKLQ